MEGEAMAEAAASVAAASEREQVAAQAAVAAFVEARGSEAGSIAQRPHWPVPFEVRPLGGDGFV